jgi:hypothetical protein
MKWLRILALVVTSPVWLIAGFFVGCITIILTVVSFFASVVSFFASVCVYGFTGEWDWL